MSHSPKYSHYIRSHQWRAKSKRAIARTKGRCCLFPWQKANHTHHLTYRNLGKELLIRDVVPLSKVAHKIVHCRLLWRSPLRKLVNYWLRLICIVLCF